MLAPPLLIIYSKTFMMYMIPVTKAIDQKSLCGIYIYVVNFISQAWLREAIMVGGFHI